MLSDRDRRVIEGPLPGTADAFRLLVWGVKEYAIFMLDASGVIVSWNEGAERIKGYRQEEIIGRHFSVFYEQPDIDAGKPDWELLVAEREGQFQDEGWRLRQDGSRFWPASPSPPSATRPASCAASARSPATSPTARWRRTGRLSSSGARSGRLATTPTRRCSWSRPRASS